MREQNIKGQENGAHLNNSTAAFAGGVSEKVNKLTDKAAGTIDEVKQGAAQLYQSTKGTAKQVSKQVSGYVQQHPIYSLAAAVGTGFIVGALLKKSK